MQSGDHRLAASGASLAMSLELLNWYAKSKIICFDGPKADDLVVRIQDALARLDSVLEVNNDDLSFEENIVEDPICIDENEVAI